MTIVKAVRMVGSIQGPKAVSDENPLAGLEELHGVISDIDRDLVRTCTQLNAKIKSLERCQASGNTVPTVLLSLSTPIHSDRGDCISTLGDLLQENVGLKEANALLA